MSNENRHVSNRVTNRDPNAPKYYTNDIESAFFGTQSLPIEVVHPYLRFTKRSNGGDKHSHNTHAGSDTETTASNELLIEPDKEHPKLPIAGPEIDDLDGERPVVTAPNPGIDDGLLGPSNDKNKPDTHNGDLNGLGPRFGIDDQPGSPMMPGRSNNTHAGSDTDTIASNLPLLEPNKEQPKPPIAGPEIDDGERPAVTAPNPGIDDGLLEPSNDKNKPDTHNGGEQHSVGGSHETPPTRDDAAGTEDGLNGLGPTTFGIDDRPGSPMMPGAIIPDVNTYQQKKNLAQGMMDLALLSANANQLRYVLESSTTHPYYYPSLTFITLSVIFQIAVGIGLIMNSRYDVKDKKEICKADRINNMTVLGIFLITIINVFISSFSVATPTTISNLRNGTQLAG